MTSWSVHYDQDPPSYKASKARCVSHSLVIGRKGVQLQTMVDGSLALQCIRYSTLVPLLLG